MFEIHEGEHMVVLKELMEAVCEHTSTCVYCKAKAFICELCNDDADLLFPFNDKKINRVSLLACLPN